jgi:poly-gamma-glutamate synthesis protein (capsule biosynthesis protein)
MPPVYVGILSGAGIDIVSIANNHIFDYGREGLFDTISYLDSAGVRHVGAGRDRREAHRPVLFHIRERTIAFLAYYGGGEAPQAGRKSPGVAHRSLGNVRLDLEALRAGTRIDFIVVSLHWGTEKAEVPDGDQRFFAHALIDAGVDAVIGHHPHVLQGIERYKSGVIAYSLGNLVFGGNSRNSYDTGLFEIRIEADGPRYAFLPVCIREWKASLAGGVERARVLERIGRLSSVFHKSPFTK